MSLLFYLVGGYLWWGWPGEDAIVAKRGKLFLAELKYRPCEAGDLSGADVHPDMRCCRDS